MPAPTSGPGLLALRLLRCVHPGRNALARTSDRLEAASWVATLVALLLAVPVALAVGTVGRADVSAQAAEEAATRHLSTAVLLEDAEPAGDGVAAGRPVWTLAGWTGPDGTGVQDEVPAPPAARVGESVEVWLDDAGRQVPRPIDRTVVVSNAVVAGTVTFLLLTAAVVTGQVVVGQLLWRHRARQWAAGWAAVEPRWAGRADR